MSSTARHPDLLSRQETADLLGVKPSTLAHGFGPAPLPDYKRPVYYSRRQVERWLSQQRKQAWASTRGKTLPSGGVASKSPVTRSSARLERKIAERLRSKSGGSGPTTNPRHLVAVPEGA